MRKPSELIPCKESHVLTPLMKPFNQCLPVMEDLLIKDVAGASDPTNISHDCEELSSSASRKRD